MIHSDLLRRQTQQPLPVKKPTGSATTADTLQISPASAPQVLAIADVSHLSTSHSCPPALLGPRNCPGSQPRPPQLHECRTPCWITAADPPPPCMYSGLALPAVHFHDTDLTPVATVHGSAHTFRETVKLQESTRMTPRTFTAAYGSRPSPVFCHSPLPHMWQDPANRGMHTAYQGSCSCRATHIWPPPVGFLTWAPALHVSLQPAPTNSQEPAAGPHSRVCARYWLWPPLLPDPSLSTGR